VQEVLLAFSVVIAMAREYLLEVLPFSLVRATTPIKRTVVQVVRSQLLQAHLTGESTPVAKLQSLQAQLPS